jgi:TM2 domain-containing membrane protein YozV
MRKIKLAILFLYMGSFSLAQNIYDGEHILRFADYLFRNKEYHLAINEYKHALFLQYCNTSCQIKLFNSYLQTQQYDAGLYTYRSIYAEGLSGNDTLEMVYGKMLILNADFTEVEKLLHTSATLSPGQLSFLNVSNDLLSDNWDKVLMKESVVISDMQINPYKSVIYDIRNLKYKKPGVSLMLSAVIPGAGKMYCGYWYDGLISLTTIGITAWQAVRGFKIYGTDRAYTWIFTSLSATFYISNLYGSYKAANMRNYSLRQNIHHAIKKVFDSTYNY